MVSRNPGSAAAWACSPFPGGNDGVVAAVTVALAKPVLSGGRYRDGIPRLRDVCVALGLTGDS
jgi:hypothetical protein